MAFTAKVSRFTEVVVSPGDLKPCDQTSNRGVALPILLAVFLLVAIGLTGCAGKVSTAKPVGEDALAPVVFVPGLGMSALNVQVLIDKDFTGFDFLLPSMNPIDILPQGASSALEYSVTSGLPREEAELVPTWMSLAIDADGVASNQPGVSVAPVSVGRDFAAECPRYLAMTNQLAAAGWTLDANLFCLPFDYRYAPGGNSFVPDFMTLVERAVSKASGQRAVVACHSQGCLMAYHALRVLDPTWVKANVSVLYGFAGQFSGCSDCLRWAFQPGWSWSLDDQNESPVDPSWVGELALDLQPSVYGDTVLYRNGTKEYRATDARALLQDAGALEMSRATGAYTLEDQDWFRRGSINGDPLPIPSRFVFGVDLVTTVGYAYDFVAVRTGSCQEPECAGFWSAVSPSVVTSDGDGGDSTLMNAAPKTWTSSPACDIRTIPGVDHMKIVTDPEAIAGLVATSHGSVEGSIPCAG
ncbi:unannotated protein [freshwater metagenome]|uniref:Unannotated protein n=1 Tax=freshwater metagenome TaxID=449393 RepID=A0A6J7ALM0_9ZZZZ